ncbi:MAG TPA: class I adenylate-forming enzyme family protein [Pseudomonadales bacterium]
MSIPDLLHVLRSHDGAAPALAMLDGLAEEYRWSYARLLNTAHGFRRVLEASGAGAGSTICVMAGNSPQFIALFLACVDLGAAFAPLHRDQSSAVLQDILAGLDATLVIVDEDVQGAALNSVLRLATRVWRLRLRRTPWLRPVLSGGAHKPSAYAAAMGEPASTGGAARADRVRLGADNAGPCSVGDMADASAPVLILHSSGSTGAPKVILYSRWRLNVFLHWQRRLFDAFPDVPAGCAPSPRVNALPLAHFGGLSFVLQALLDGRLVHLPRAIAPREYLVLALQVRCQLLMFVPALYEALVDDAIGALPPSALRYCLTMGEAVTPQLIALVTRTLGVRVFSAYGMSEGLSGLSHHGDDTPPDSCGRLRFGEAKLVDSDADAEAGEATEGELWVRNDTTFPCYRDDSLNAAKFVDGWYRTGDRFRRDALGHHFFLGRVDAMCVVNGRNLYPADVERVFLRHRDVADCMAAILTLDKGRRRLGVLVCLRADSQASPTTLIDWYVEHGALHATPAWLVLGKGIPRNAAGKRDRLAVATILEEDYRRCLRKVS